MLDPKRLLIFKEVAERGSFSAAAHALSYTQPAVSHHVAQLELEVGAKLVTRRSRGPHLTPAGEVLYEHACGILERVAEAETAVAEVTGRGTRVRLGAFATASATVVVDALARLGAQAPQVRISLVEGEATDTIMRLKAHQIDVAIVFDSLAYALTEDPDVSYAYVGSDPMLLALPARHPIVRQPEIRLTDLATEGWIEGAGAETAASLILLEACQRAGFEPRVAFNSGNYQVVLRLVAAGVGVALIPRLAVCGDLEHIAIRSLADGEVCRRIALATRRNGYRSPGMGLVMAELSAACARRLEPLSAD
ncbi:MAG: LysR substrate-binding domain-containing protein [Solirubrobacteraceae bacterium]